MGNEDSISQSRHKLIALGRISRSHTAMLFCERRKEEQSPVGKWFSVFRSDSHTLNAAGRAEDHWFITT